MEDVKQKRFLWGVALCWAPWAPMIIALGSIFRGIAGSKATGIAAVAGAFAEAYVMTGMAATLICEVGAMVLLVRSFPRGHGVRSTFSVLSICVSGLMLLLFCLSIWLFWFVRHQAF